MQFFDLRPIPKDPKGRRNRQAEALQLYHVLALGTPLCYIYNLLHGYPRIKITDEIDVENVERHDLLTGCFLAAIKEPTAAGHWIGDAFTLSDLYQGDPDPEDLVKVSGRAWLSMQYLSVVTGRQGGDGTG